MEFILSGYESLLGSNDPKTLDAMNNLANIYHQLGKLEKSRELYEKTLAKRELQLLSSQTNTLMTEFNLGNLYKKQNRLHEAYKHYTISAEGFSELLGESHNYTNMSTHALNSIKPFVSRQHIHIHGHNEATAAASASPSASPHKANSTQSSVDGSNSNSKTTHPPSSSKVNEHHQHLNVKKHLDSSLKDVSDKTPKKTMRSSSMIANRTITTSAYSNSSSSSSSNVLGSGGSSAVKGTAQTADKIASGGGGGLTINLGVIQSPITSPIKRPTVANSSNRISHIPSPTSSSSSPASNRRHSTAVVSSSGNLGSPAPGNRNKSYLNANSNTSKSPFSNTDNKYGIISISYFS